jgi:predicted regulator of Ras-like GTPase activity (Roadblock/LC7/MglB family)
MLINYPLRQSIRKIETKMKRNSTFEVTIERKNLSKIFEADHLEISNSNHIYPLLKQSTIEYFNLKGILTIYYSNKVKFYKILKIIPEAEVVAIVSIDGFPIGSVYQKELIEAKRAAMNTALFSLAKKASSDMENGKFEQMFVKGTNGYLLIMKAGPNALLTASTNKKVKLGLLISHCHQICENLTKLL